MELAKPIEAAPKNGDFLILQDACSWEVGRWAREAGTWVQLDGTPVRIFPTCWARISGDIAGATDHERLPFLDDPLRADEPFPPKQRSRTSLILPLAAAVFCAGGLGYWIGFEDSNSDRAATLATKLTQQRYQADATIRDLTAERDRQTIALAEVLESKRIAEARQKDLQQALDQSDAGAAELASDLSAARENAIIVTRLTSAREGDKAALTQAIESKRIAETRQKGLKQALDESEVKAEALSRELASARENAATIRQITTARERDKAALAEATERRRVAEARQNDLKLALDDSEAKAVSLARELASARETIASSGKPSDADATARHAASPAESLNRPVADATVKPGTQARIESSTPGAIPSAEEVKLIARAESLIKQSDFASARLLLEHAMEKGSARAAFVMAETYDWRILRSLRAYGASGDAQMAREFYELAAAAGIEKARERVDALQSDAAGNTPTSAEKRIR